MVAKVVHFKLKWHLSHQIRSVSNEVIFPFLQLGGLGEQNHETRELK